MLWLWIALCAAPGTLDAVPTRYEKAAPLPGLPAVRLDSLGNGVGVAQLLARSHGLQGRILWVDCTANIERYNTEAKIDALVERAASIGFNTIVFDVKPIVGNPIYPSEILPQLETWRGRTMPKGFDPIPIFSRACRRAGLSLLLAMNAFSEGHRIAREAGTDAEGRPRFEPDGYALQVPEQQSVLYTSTPAVGLAGTTSAFGIGGDGPVAHTLSGAEMPRSEGDRVAVAIDASGRVTRGLVGGERWERTEVAALAASGEAGAMLGRARDARARLVFSAIGRRQRSAEVDDQIPLMMNPFHPDVRARSLRFVEEVASYDIDGLLYDDRLRYAGMQADFSDHARASFERFVGERVTWPEDVYGYTYTPRLQRGIRPGKWYDAWLAWRAQHLTTWVREAGALFRHLRPGCVFGVYAGSWYGEYPKFGSNWASNEFEAGFPFLTREYRSTGYASALDIAILGAYYPTATIVDAMEQGRSSGPTVEAAGQLSNRAIRDQAWTYVGIMLNDFRDDPRRLAPALQAACGSSQGVMVFDLSHEFERFEPILRAAFHPLVKAPHAVPGLLAEVRALRALKDRRGDREPAVWIREGAAGAGH